MKVCVCVCVCVCVRAPGYTYFPHDRLNIFFISGVYVCVYPFAGREDVCERCHTALGVQFQIVAVRWSSWSS